MKKLIITSILALIPFIVTSAQSQDAEKDPETVMYESIDKEIDRLQKLLNLDETQLFYVDSTLTHDMKAMQAELMELQSRRVYNNNIYYAAQYKWQEAIYQSYSHIFNEKQWEKYQKSGAAKLKKSRDKFFNKSNSKK